MFHWVVKSILFSALASWAVAIEPVFDLPHRGCYYTNWAQYRPGNARFTPANVDPSLCTYIAIAFASIVNNQLTTLEWNDLDTYQALAALKTSHPNLKLFLSVGGATLTTPLATMSATAGTRATFIASVVANLRAWNLDGLDVDWEFPYAADKPNYSALLTELRAAFEAESTQTGKQRLALSVALHVVSDGGFDGAVINSMIDIGNVMTYDLFGAWDLTGTGHEAALLIGPRAQPSPYNVATMMQEWVDLGVSKSKLVVGLPLYGRGWMLASPSSHGLGAPVTAPINAGAYTAAAGSWAYFEVCQNIQANGATVVFNTDIQASYAYTSTWWIGYDDIRTVTAKTNWAKSNGFAGVYVWDVSQDDFTNSCGAGQNPLLTAATAALTSGPAATTSSPSATTTRPSTTSKSPTTTARTPPPTFATTKATTTTQKPSTTSTIKSTMRTASTTRTTTRSTTRSTSPAPTMRSTTLNSGALVCGHALCQQSGPGLVALGPCNSGYCNCDGANNGYLGSCGTTLVFDVANQYCNYKNNVPGCAS